VYHGHAIEVKTTINIINDIDDIKPVITEKDVNLIFVRPRTKKPNSPP